MVSLWARRWQEEERDRAPEDGGHRDGVTGHAGPWGHAEKPVLRVDGSQLAWAGDTDINVTQL